MDVKIGGCCFARVCWFDWDRREWKLLAGDEQLWLRDVGIELHPGQEVSVAWEQLSDGTRKGYAVSI